MSKKKEERQLQIRQILEGKEKIKVTELAKLLSVTPETLRKDLDELQERKILVREHGYAKIQSSSVETFVELKAQKNKEMKKIVKEDLPKVSGDIADFHRNVVAVIRDGAEPEIKLFQVMRVMKLMEAIFQAAETKQVIEFQDQV